MITTSSFADLFFDTRAPRSFNRLNESVDFVLIKIGRGILSQVIGCGLQRRTYLRLQVRWVGFVSPGRENVPSGRLPRQKCCVLQVLRHHPWRILDALNHSQTSANFGDKIGAWVRL